MLKRKANKRANRKMDAYSVALFTSLTQENANAYVNNKYIAKVDSNAENAYSKIGFEPASVWPMGTGYPKVVRFF